MVLVQKWPFFQLLVLRNIGQENVFYDILEGKNVILGSKNKKSKKSKNWHFSKGVNPWFWSKYGHFSNLLFIHYWLGKCCSRYSRTKKRLPRLQNWHFSKSVYSLFCSKCGHFPTFFYSQYWLRKCFLRYSRTKKRLSRLQKQAVQKVEELTFFQRG